MLRSSLYLLAFAILTVTLLLPAELNAQGSVPPAHTYHLDQYGRETRVVKERWGENSSGEKHGVYLRYAPDGTPTAKIIYSNGVKNGPSYETITNDWQVTEKYVGSYLNGNKDGWWSIYDMEKDGRQGLLNRKVQFVTGDLKVELVYQNGKNTGVYTWARNSRNGPAKVFGNTALEVGTGAFTNDNPSGTWLNAAFDDNPIFKQIIYRKGAKLVFENGELVGITDANGTVRSLTAEKAQAAAAAAKEGAAQEARNEDARLENINLPKGISFYSDSYVLTKAAMQLLDEFAKEINLRRDLSKYKVKQFYISIHTDTPKGEISEGSEKQNYVLTLNRAVAIRTYLLNQLVDRSIAIITYPCGLNMPKHVYNYDDPSYSTDGLRVEFARSRDMYPAQAVYDQLSKKYNLKSGDALVPSTALQENILNTIRAYYENEGVLSTITAAVADDVSLPVYAEKIPSELWLSDLDVDKSLPKGYAEVENVMRFRNQVETLVVEMNKKYIKFGTPLSPSAFFNQDLRRRTKQ